MGEKKDLKVEAKKLVESTHRDLNNISPEEIANMSLEELKELSRPENGDKGVIIKPGEAVLGEGKQPQKNEEVKKRKGQREVCPICGEKYKNLKSHIRLAHPQKEAIPPTSMATPPASPTLPTPSTPTSTPTATIIYHRPWWNPFARDLIVSTPIEEPNQEEVPVLHSVKAYNRSWWNPFAPDLQAYIFQRRGDSLEGPIIKGIKIKKDKTGVYMWFIGKASILPIAGKYIQSGNKVYLEYTGFDRYSPLQLKISSNPGELEAVNPFANPELIMDYNLYRLNTERIYKSKPGLLQQLLPFLLIFAFAIGIVIIMFGASSYLGPLSEKIHSDVVRLAELSERLGLFQPAAPRPPG